MTPVAVADLLVAAARRVSLLLAQTIHYQIVRPDVFSPWALHPGLKPLQTVLEVFAVLLALAVALVPGERSLARVGALAGAVTIAIQLPATHWFYYYIVWFLPFLLVAVLAPLARPRRPPKPRRSGSARTAGATPSRIG